MYRSIIKLWFKYLLYTKPPLGWSTGTLIAKMLWNHDDASKFLKMFLFDQI